MREDLPERLSDEELLTLTVKLRSGNATQEDVDKLVHGYIRLALYYASKYSQKQHRLKDVFESDALFGLIVALAKAPEKLKHDELTRYIVCWMRKYIFKTITEDKTVIIPYTTLKSNEKKGITITFQKQSSKGPENLQNLKETIETCIKKVFEREVIALRELGHNDEEISVILSCSRTKVTAAKNKVYKRFIKVEKDD